MEPENLYSTEGGWSVRLWENPQIAESAAAHGSGEQRRAAGGEFTALDTAYEHSAACLLPTKVTATQMKGRELDAEIAQGSQPARTYRTAISQPRFLQEKQGLTAAERGTAMHLAMQYLPFDTAPTQEAVAARVKEMAENRLLTPQQAEAVDCRKLLTFLSLPIADEIRGSALVLREYRFALLVPATVYDPRADAAEEMMLQGVVDCCFETEEGLVIVDFKTDRIRPGEEAERAEVYRPQLEAYAHALEQVLEKKVCRKMLWFFTTDSAVNLDK